MIRRRAFLSRLLCFTLVLTVTLGSALAQNGGELRFCLRSEPKTFDPLLVDDDSSLSIRYLTGGVLVRVNRHTQDLEPELAESWKLSNGGKVITFKLRHGVSFSDGTAFSSEDVVFTSGATESNNLALLGIAAHAESQGRRQDGCRRMGQQPVDSVGRHGQLGVVEVVSVDRKPVQERGEPGGRAEFSTEHRRIRRQLAVRGYLITGYPERPAP